ncbi:Cullin-associated NEDD8-dissociated protein 1 [Apophysomyces ossiformis]|uniref:Cullin-associated NEDD8-dissociated protein 1 n=1 Tax=Apophysomyces ossiformis TaxID=679940 RepID=A0A8H7ER30_9FUNG|nr:Cullin-associated NEDD8-dissociated protein 1 [Apophysomyces ossiformis]
MSSTNAYMVANLLEKMDNEDRDFRYMALNDLTNELQKDTFDLEPSIEAKVVRAVLTLMDDKNSEVQNLAVKCLGPLVKQIKEEHALDIVDRLGVFAAQQKNEELRSIASIGMKTVVMEVHGSKGNSICQKVVPHLLPMLQNTGASYEMQMDSLDVLAEVLSRFGSQITQKQQAQIQTTLLPLLAHPRAAIRKRTTIAIGHLVVHINDELFDSIMLYVLERIKATGNPSDKLRTLVQSAGVLSRYSTARLGKYLPQLVPVIMAYASEADEDDELREICLQSLESFILRCPTEISPYIDQIISLALEYIKYDPNFAADDDEDDEDEDMEEDEEEDDEYGDIVDYSDDDDDMSWKVRRSSAKLFAAIIETRTDLLQQLYQNVAPVLIARFKEREESVRADIMQTFIVLLRQTNVYGGDNGFNSQALYKSAFDFDVTGYSDQKGFSSSKDQAVKPATSLMQTGEGPRQLLRSQVPKLSRALVKQLSSKSNQTRLIGFRLARELVLVLHGGLDEEMDLFVPVIESTLTTSASDQHHATSTSNLKIEVLVFLNQLFRNHSSQVLQPYLNRLCPAVIKAIADRFYKITSEAFLVCIELIKVVRPIWLDPKTGEFDISPIDQEHKQFIVGIYAATLKVLGTSDADQEVKERSIMCLGALLGQAGDALLAKQREAWDVLLDRIRNEVTRLVGVKTLTVVSQSPVAAGEELERCVLVAVDEIALLLRKSERALRISSLECLIILINRFGRKISDQSYHTLLNELKPLVADSDLHLLPLALKTAECIVTVHPNSVDDVKSALLPSLFQLIQSPLLQGTALTSLLNLFEALAKTSPADYQILVKGLVDPLLAVETSGVSAGGVAAVANKQAAATVAQCVAVLAVNTDQINCQETISTFQKYIENPSTNDSVKYLSLLTLGEIGRRIDLSRLGDIHERILALFSAQSEEVKFAAAFALGNVSVGNIGQYLPLIVTQIKEQPKRRYLLLHSLKEIITRYDQHRKECTLGEASNDIWNLLLESSESDQEEGTRTVVAECLGKLSLTDPPKFLPQLQERLSSPSGPVRSTVVTAVKYAVVDPSQEHDELLKPIILQFLALLQDSELEELIHTVEMGPFKHKVDDGLEIRKAAYECMYTLLGTCLDKLDIYGFLERVRVGLEDQHDIKMLTYLMLIQLSKIATTAVSQKLDDLVAPLKATLDFKMRSNAVKQEVERNQELVRATLRCIVSLAVLSDPGVTPRFDNFVKEVKVGPLGEEYKMTAKMKGVLRIFVILLLLYTVNANLFTYSSPTVIQDAVWIFSNSSSIAHEDKDIAPLTYDSNVSPAVNLTQPNKNGLRGILVDRDLSCNETPADIIASPINQQDIPRIALIKRGQCSFTEKLLFAQKYGAVGAIVYDNNTMYDNNYQYLNRKNNEEPMSIPPGSGVTIPAYYVNKHTGDELFKRLLTCSQTQTQDYGDMTAKLAVRVLMLPANTSGPNPWELTLIIVIALLAISFFASVGMHWHLWRKRRRQRRMIEQGLIPTPLDMLPMGKRLLDPSNLDSFPSRVITEESLNAQKDKLPVEQRVDMEATEQQPAASCISSDDVTCVICLEGFNIGDVVRELPCEHEYHCTCIDPWLTSKAAECPLCKYDCAKEDKDDTPDTATVPPSSLTARIKNLFRRSQPEQTSREQ